MLSPPPLLLSPLPSEKQTQGSHATGRVGDAGQIFINWDQFGLAGPSGEERGEPDVRLALRAPDTPAGKEPGFVGVLEARDAAHGRWMLRFLVD